MSFSVALKGRPLSRTELLLPLAWEKLTGTLSMARLMYLEEDRDTSRIEIDLMLLFLVASEVSLTHKVG